MDLNFEVDKAEYYLGREVMILTTAGTYDLGFALK